jgi:protein gp37
MGESTGIEWTHHTWSPWWGCTKVSDGCKNCYADILSNRWGFKIWGPNADRRFFGDKHWNDPLRWNRAAEKAGERRRIFPSMCDPFEAREDLIAPRARMFELIDKTPWLDWLLVTKRPENIRDMWPVSPGCALKRRHFQNVWLLTSTEDQATAHQRIPELLKCCDLVPVLGLSAEPLLGPIDLTPFAAHSQVHNAIPLDWVIVGGESQNGARPMHPDWARKLQNQCAVADIPFFFKQWGEYVSGPIIADEEFAGGYKVVTTHGTAALQGRTVRLDQFTGAHHVGKKHAGSLLDGREHKAFPKPEPRP